jgi:hypothetical protein
MRYHSVMPGELIEVDCPCCRTLLKIDRETGAVISHKEPERPAPIEDLAAAVQKLKGEAAKREEVFQKSFSEQKNRQSVLDKKFDELLRQAKEDPDKTPPKRPMEFD